MEGRKVQGANVPGLRFDSASRPESAATPGASADLSRRASGPRPESIVEQSAPPMPTTTTLVVSQAPPSRGGSLGDLPATGATSWLALAAITVCGVGSILLWSSRRHTGA